MGVMSVSYTTINGEIVSENRNGVPSDYIPDALGSTIALLSDTHQITDTWTYWPNGQVRTRTGTNPTPFTFVGTRGYHSDIVNDFTYVRARELRVALSRWQTVDVLWPQTLGYAYVLANPPTYADPSGLEFSNTAECKDLCQSTFKKSGDRSECEIACKDMKMKNCAGLRSFCGHAGRGHHDTGVSSKVCAKMMSEFCKPPSATVPVPLPIPGPQGAEDRARGVGVVAARGVTAGAALYGLWVCGKWIIAIPAAPDTGGLSLGLLATP
jgi:hypothetical protein